MARAEGLVAYVAVVPGLNLLVEEHSLTLAEILAVAEVCVGAVHVGNEHRSGWGATPKELVAYVGKALGFGNAVASSALPPCGLLP